MAEDGSLDTLKDQYIEEVLSVLPLIHLVFIFLFLSAWVELRSHPSFSPVAALTAIGLKQAVGPDDGVVWTANLVSVLGAFLLAALNGTFARRCVHHSLKKAKVTVSIHTWQNAAASHIAGLTTEQKTAIAKSFGNEINLRLKRYKAKRLITELVTSLVATIFYLSLAVAAEATFKWQTAFFEWIDFATIISLGFVAVLCHRNSIKYAITAILPMKVYLGVLTSEITFFEEISA